MVFCTKCGTQSIDESAKFCHKCGAPLVLEGKENIHKVEGDNDLPNVENIASTVIEETEAKRDEENATINLDSEQRESTAYEKGGSTES